MIIYEVSNKEHHPYRCYEYYTDQKFYLHRENAQKDLRERLNDRENVEFHIWHLEDGEMENER
jgi:hypothetical protein